MDCISDGKSKLFPHICLAHKLQQLVWFSSLHLFPPPSVRSYIAPGLCPRLLHYLAGLEGLSGMHLGPSEQPPCPSKPSAHWVLSSPVPCWRTNTTNECYRVVKRTGSIGASVITLYSCLRNWMAGFDDPGPLLPSYKSWMHLGVEDVQEQGRLLRECWMLSLTEEPVLTG